MKYIRTKYAIYQDLGTDSLGWRKILCGKNTETLNTNEKVIREADAIEELCDYWMYINATNDYIIKLVNGGDSTKESLARSQKRGMVREIKLGILTDKGLLYVAKMNEKGELELL